jgi:GDP-L-fucose synthase
MKRKNILVAGASGFIGTNLTKRLLELGARVKGVVYKNNLRIKHKNLLCVRGDLRDENFCNEITEGMDYVFMCAANTSGAAIIEKTPLVHVTPNLIMNSLMLNAAYCAHVKKFLFISSSTVYPNSARPMAELDMKFDFFDKYYFVGWTKAFSEVLCRMYGQKLKRPMSVVVVRPSNSYGPYDDYDWETSHVIPSLIRKAVEKHNPIEVWGDGNDVRDFLFVDDLVDGLVKCMQKINGFEIINLATGMECTVKEILQIILRTAGHEKANVIFNRDKPTMIPKRSLDTTKAKEMIEFCPSTTLEEGIAKAMACFKNKD